jgi:glycosyltransferase involved in cell wall biosynthesis
MNPDVAAAQRTHSRRDGAARREAHGRPSASASAVRRPSVSVVIPTIGRWDFVSRSVRSALMQHGVAVEVLVVGDGTDPRASRLGILDDPRVRVLARAERRGVAAARNTGIQAARADWIALLDDDDLWAPHKLRRQLDAAARGAAFAYASSVVLDRDLRMLRVERAPSPRQLRAMMVRHNPIPACASNLLVRADVARAVGFDNALLHFADWDFALRLILASEGVACAEPLVGYVQHGHGMHQEGRLALDPEFGRLGAKEGHRDLHLGSPTFSRWVAGAHRGSNARWGASRSYLQAALRYRSLPDLLRAIVILTFGDRAMRAVRTRLRPPATIAEPDWLALYR